MDIEFIRNFILVVECGSFAKASSLTYKDRATISRQITSLEASLQTTLFIRSSNNLILTSDGKYYYDNFKHIILNFDNVLRKANRTSLTDANHILNLSVFALDDYPDLDIILKQYQHSYSDVKVNIMNITSRDDMASMLTSFDTDIVLDMIKPTNIPVNIHVIELSKLYASLIYSLSRSIPPSLDTLSNEIILLPSNDLNPTAENFVNNIERLSKIKIANRIFYNSIDECIDHININDHIALLPKQYTYYFPGKNFKINNNIVPPQPLYAMWNSDNTNPLINNFFMYVMRDKNLANSPSIH